MPVNCLGGEANTKDSVKGGECDIYPTARLKASEEQKIAKGGETFLPASYLHSPAPGQPG